MATVDTQNRVYLFRLQVLIIDGGLLVLRNILDQKLNAQNISLSICLSQEKPTITRLKGQKTITQVQYDLLYPAPGGQPPSTADFDITLIICLLRNLKCCGFNRKFNWNVIPNASDKSIEADIYRLKFYRNEMSHISTTTGIKLKDFRFKWTAIEQILMRLNTSVTKQVPNLQQTIDDIKKSPLDPAAEERIQKEVDEWRKLEKGVEVDLRQVKEDAQSTKEEMRLQEGKVKEIYKRTSEHTERIRSTQNKVADLEVDLRQVKVDDQYIKEEVKLQQGKAEEIYKCTTENAELIRGTRNKVADLEVDLRQVKVDDQSIKEEVKLQQGKVEEIYKCTSENTELIRGTQNKVADLEKQIAKSNESTQKQKEQEETSTQESAATRGSEEAVKRKTPNVFKRLFLRRGREMEDLKEDLITLYRQQYHTLPLSPLIEEEDTPLLKFYVTPDINSVENQRSFGGGNEIKSKVASLRDVFCKKDKTCREIYLTADAGFGKTAFSMRLVLTWCQAKKRIKSDQKFFKKEDIQTMSEFEFVFLLSLRDCSEECDIDEMIVKKIIPRLAHPNVTLSDIETILSKGKVLVILDGLDEWIHPKYACMLGPSDIPHRKARECTILTTSRPWKLSVISLRSSQIEQKLEIVGLNKTSAKTLKKNVISLLIGNINNEKHFQDFNSIVEHKGISDLETTPLLLMYLLCLWCDGMDLGRSKYELYCQIVELLLKRTFEKYPDIQQAREPLKSDISQCFSELVNYKKYYSLLTALGQLAVETLFSENRESTLVFSKSVSEKYLNKDDLKLCLLSGILTQSKEVKLTRQSSKVSFSHKTLQEYFCALHICCQNENDVQNLVQQRFNSVQNILDMSKVFVFISGMNAEIMSSISHELKSVISEDQITKTFRSMANFDYRYIDPLKDIQNMYISCLKENTDNTSLCFQDFIIDHDYQKEKHLLDLKWLAKHSKINMQSIFIRKSVHSLRELTDQCEFDDMYNVKKIYYDGECKDAEIIRLLTNKSLESVTVISRTRQGNNFISKCSSCSSELFKTFQNISQLRAICIESFEFEHDVLKEFLNYIINRKSMAEIRLYDLHCNTHEISCGEMNLDFSQHSDLCALGLDTIPVSQLKVNVSSLEDCDVGHLSKPGLVTSFLGELPAASKLRAIQCSYLESSDDIETWLQTLPLLVQVKDVTLQNINLGERSLCLSPEMVHIELVYLDNVTMSGSSLRNLVTVVEKLPQSVTVIMRDCNIRPERKFADVKKYIKASENFIVGFDGINQLNQCAFEFQTTEAGSRVGLH
ncbi:uncharacterized protein LOC128548044 [Mercenaria mercenaria]|uniref:uncharacterized protein LOC128548044 n=1 Tax=Mercenaria mercenaria TaxID=6596 RepID=UPI00234E90DA|nr:uncharacterized protein LOC128548044 [Mercenaria mercenaria]